MVKDIIQYGPTLLFLWIVLVGFVIGLIRGFRKSSILAIHALVAFIVCAIIYVAIANSKSTDTKVVEMANKVLGDGKLQEMFDVSETNKTLSDILKASIIKNMDYGDAIAIIVENDGAYIATLVSLAYHIILFIIMLPIYWLFVFVLYIIYLLFYPERRHKQKVQEDDELKKKYKKHIFLGGAVGALRNTVKAVLILSLIGAAFYVVGGTGEKKYSKEYDFGSSDKNTFYDVYTAVGSYGNSGIYKILNTAKDKNEMPYYLYASSTIFSGVLDDDNRNIDTKVNFIDEFGAYVQFSRDTFDLMMETDSEAVINLMNDNNDANRERFYSIFEDPTFQEKFSKLIIDFDEKVYFNNLILSTIESVANNIDNLKFTENLSKKNLELLRIILKKDYLSDYIPEEREAKLSGKTAKDIGGVATLDVTKILTREDTASLAVALLSILGATTEDTQYSKVSGICENLIPAITDLSILSSESRKEEVNPFFARLYTALNNIYLNDDTENEVNPLKTELRLNQVETVSNKYSNLDWQVELQSLVDTSDNLISLFNNLYTDDGSKISAKSIVGTIFDVFDNSNAKYEENIEYYNKIEESIENSKLLDMVLDSSFISKKISKQVTKIYSDAYAYDSINYADSENAHGEFYQFLNAIEAIASDKTNKDILLDLIDNNIDTSTTSAILDLIDKIAKLLDTKDSNNTRAIEYALSSKIVQSYLSAYILGNRDLGNATLYIPEGSYAVIDSSKVNMISSEELTNLFDSIPIFIDIIDPYFDSTSEHYESVDYILEQLSLEQNMAILDNKIIEGTISSVAKGELESSDSVKMPSSYSSIEEWLSTSNKDGEIKSLVKVVNKSNISISNIINGTGTDSNEILNIIKTLPEEAIALMVKSNILVYTVSNYVGTNDLNGVKIVVPNSVRIDLTSDSIPYKITDNELYNFLLEVQKVLPENSENISSNDLIRNVMNNRTTIVNSYIISATVVNYFVNDNPEIKEQIIVPEHLVLDAKYDDESKTLLDYNEGTEWFIELPLMLDSIEAYVGFTRDDSINLEDEEATTIKLKSNVKILNLTLDKVYSDLGKTYEGIETRTVLEICELSSVTYATISYNVEGMLSEETLENPDGVIKPEQKSALRDDFTHTYKGTVYTYHYLSSEELESLANVINELNIDVENIVLDDVMGKFITLNDPTELEQYQEVANKPTKLELLYQSEIFNILLYNAIKDEITRSDILVDGGIDSKASSIHSLEIYTYQELSKLVRFVNIIDTSRPEAEQEEGRIRIGDIELSDINLTDEQINLASTSYIISATITDKLLSNNTFIINNDYYYQTNKSIIEYQLKSLLTNIVLFSGTSNASDLVEYDVTNAVLTTNNIQYIIASSILKDTVSDLIADNTSVSLNDEYCTPFDAILSDDSLDEKVRINEYELNSFLQSLVLIGFGNVGSLSQQEIENLTLTEEKIDNIIDSNIMADSVSKNIINNENVVVENDSNVSQIVLYNNATAYTINRYELKQFLNALIDLGINSVSSYSSNTIDSIELDSDKVSSIVSSYIMSDTVSKNIIYESDLIVKKSISYTITSLHDNSNYSINSIELESFLNALVSLGFSNQNDIDEDTINDLEITSDLIEIIQTSEILEMTVAKKVMDNEAVIVKSSDVIEVTLYDDQNESYITSTELESFLNALITLNLAKINLIDENTIKSITINNSNEYKMVTDLCNSLIMINILSDNIISNSMTIVNTDYVTEDTNFRTSEAVYAIDEYELELFLKAFTDLEIGSINDISDEAIKSINLSEEIALSITNSEIMNDICANNVLENESVVVTIDVYEEFTRVYKDSLSQFAFETKGTITNTELYLFLIAAHKGLNITTIDGVNEDNIVIPETVDDNLTNSDIMCATITSKVKCDDKYVFVEDDIQYVDTNRKDRFNNDINVLSQQEIEDFINSSNVLDPEDNNKDYNTTINVQTLQHAQADGVLDDITKSNILRILISDVLLRDEYQPYIDEIPSQISAVRVVSVDGMVNYYDGTQNIFTQAQIASIISELPTA